MNTEIPSFKDFYHHNKGGVYAIDYIQLFLNRTDFKYDLLYNFSKICLPEFELIDDFLFNISFGCHKVYLRNVAEGVDRDEAHYWAHVIPISDIFDLEDQEDAMEFGRRLAASWNWVLRDSVKGAMEFEAISEEDGVYLVPVKP